MNTNIWVNYGDTNFVEHGGMFVRRDGQSSCYDIVQLVTIDSGRYTVHSGYLDILDSWIDKQAVLDYMGMSGIEEMKGEHYAVAVAEYYGMYEISGGCSGDMFNSKADVLKELQAYGIVDKETVAMCQLNELIDSVYDNWRESDVDSILESILAEELNDIKYAKAIIRNKTELSRLTGTTTNAELVEIIQYIL